MSSSSKLFFILVLLVAFAGILLYKGIEEELIKRNSIPSPLPSQSAVLPNEHVLGDQISETTQSAQINEVSYQVTKVVDGDTIQVVIDDKPVTVRLIGIDTPETVHPTKGKQCFGQEASDKTKELLTGKWVILEKDVSETDKYDRLLRYVYIVLDGVGGKMLFVNDYLVREGYAQVLTYPPDVKYNEQFLDAQRQSKNMKKGLWGKCP